MQTHRTALSLNTEAHASELPTRNRHRRMSDTLQAIADAAFTPDERISLGQLTESFGNRAFGVLLFVFAIPVALPIAIPGISAVLGAPLLFLSWQLMRGHERPWLPKVMSRRSFRRDDFVNMLSRVLPWIRRVERLVGPRLFWLTNPRSEQVIGLLAFVFSLILFLPIPFGNAVPALSVAILALAILERDGVAAIVGTLVGFIGVGIVSGFIFAMIQAALFVIHTGLTS